MLHNSAAWALKVEASLKIKLVLCYLNGAKAMGAMFASANPKMCQTYFQLDNGNEYIF